MGRSIIEIHFASKRKPSQNEGSSELKVTLSGINKNTVAILRMVNMKT